MEEAKFLKLRNKWYDKLKKAGFKDIENTHKDKLFPVSYDLKASKHKTGGDLPIEMYIDQPTDLSEYTEAYYTKCRSLLHEIKFEKKIEKKVWELFSEGVSYRVIGRKHNISHVHAFNIVKKYKKKYL